MSLSTQDLKHVETIHADLALRTFAWETRVGHHLAYLRTLASPTVAGLLAHTGEMEKHSVRRATDTGLWMYELITHGLDSPQGHFIVSRLNEMHGRWKISQEDYLWILGTFVFMPCRAIDAFGWRLLTDDEREATAAWYRELGHRMGIAQVPDTYWTWSAEFDRYEHQHLRQSPGGLRLMESTWNVALGPVPARLRPLARQAAACLISEPARTALGIDPPNVAVRALVCGALRINALKLRLRGPAKKPWFESGAAHTSYPNGYALNDLGPDRPETTSTGKGTN